jgi:hypothetical protein
VLGGGEAGLNAADDRYSGAVIALLFGDVKSQEYDG